MLIRKTSAGISKELVRGSSKVLKHQKSLKLLRDIDEVRPGGNVNIHARMRQVEDMYQSSFFRNRLKASHSTLNDSNQTPTIRKMIPRHSTEKCIVRIKHSNQSIDTSKASKSSRMDNISRLVNDYDPTMFSTKDIKEGLKYLGRIYSSRNIFKGIQLSKTKQKLLPSID